jgi:hypothetical protein
MDALVLWRSTTLQSNSTETHSRAPSPAVQSDEEPLSSSDEREELKRSESEPLEVSKKPTSSSWSRWWSRSRSSREGDPSGKSNRPELRGTASETVSLGSVEEGTILTAFYTSDSRSGDKTGYAPSEGACISGFLPLLVCAYFNTSR